MARALVLCIWCGHAEKHHRDSPCEWSLSNDYAEGHGYGQPAYTCGCANFKSDEEADRGETV